MLSSIMVLISSLDNNIMEYQAAISAYDKCNPAVCTLGYIHAEMLSQNSSLILKYVCYIHTMSTNVCMCIFDLQC